MRMRHRGTRLLAAALLGWAALLHADGPLDGIDPRDPKALLKAGISFEGKGRASFALQCYRRVLQLGAGEDYPEAAFRLARIELGRKKYEAAYSLLREVAAKYGHAEARALLAAGETKESRAQIELIDRGNEALGAGKHKEARKHYEDAYALFPGRETPAAFAPRKEVLRLIARCVDLIDDDHYRQKVQPAERSVTACDLCKSAGGFVSCANCKGTGLVRVKVRRVIQKVVDVACPGCRASREARSGTGWVFCERCKGLQHYTQTDKLTDNEKKAIIAVVSRVRDLKVLSRPLSNALESVETVLLNVEDGATLNFFRSLTPAYSISSDLKTALGPVPPPPEAIRKALPAWKTAGADARTRANFLISYSIDYSRHLRLFDMLRASRKKVDFKSPPSARALGPEAVTPEVLSAFPDDGTAGWVAVRGYLEKYVEGPAEPWGKTDDPNQAKDEADKKAKKKAKKKKQEPPGSGGGAQAPGDPMKGRLIIQGESPHNVNFFVWLPGAATHLKLLEKGPWYARIAGLGDAYPFTVRDIVSRVPPGHQVTLAGRFLRDRLGYPRNWFEVWDVQVGLSRAQEAAYLALKEPVVAEFAGVTASEIGNLLQVLHGVRVEWQGAEKDSLVDLTAEDCPLGLAVDALAKALDLPWRFEDGAIRMGKKPKGTDLGQVLAELSASTKGKAAARRAESTAGQPRTGELPEDPGARAALAEGASREMDYALAARSSEALAASAPSAAEKARLLKARDRFLLFHELTRQTPRSGLVGSKELAQLTIRNPAGDVHVQTVRIIAEESGLIRCVPSYGGTIGIPADLVRARETLSGEEWRRQKDAEMKDRLRKLGGATPRQKVTELFLLALFAKTNAFPERGTALLEKASGAEEFSWLLSMYFPPARSRELVESWSLVTGRNEAPPPPAAVTETPAGATGPRPDEPVPASTAELLPFARRHYDEGRARLSRSLPGMDGAQESLKLARDHFRAAQSALEKLAGAGQEDAAAKRLSQEVSEMLIACVKGLGFFD